MQREFDCHLFLWDTTNLPFSILAKETDGETPIFDDNLFTILHAIRKFPTSDEEISEFEMYIPASKAGKKSPCTHLSQEKKVFQECWLSFLKRPSQTHQKEILTIMPTRIIPHFSKPQLLMDFLTDSYDSGTHPLHLISSQDNLTGFFLQVVSLLCCHSMASSCLYKRKTSTIQTSSQNFTLSLTVI